MEKNRQDALNLLREFNKNESLVKHGLAVEAAMRAYARVHGENEEKWGMAGLLHDVDYEMFPSLDKHALEGYRILKERGFPEDVARAVMSHSDHTNTPRQTPMEKTLHAVDELSGFIIAVALVRPNKSLAEVDAQAVRKKMKDKAFARAVNRDEIVNGAEELGVNLDEHINLVARALEGVAADLGLAGKQ